MLIENKNSLFKILFVIVTLAILYFSIDVVIYTLIGIGMGVLLTPILDKIQKLLKIKRGFAAVLVIICAFILFSIGSFFFGQVIYEQASALIRGMPELSNLFQERLEALFEKFPFIIEFIKDFDIPAAVQTTFSYIFKGAKMGSFALGGFLFAMILGVYLAVDSQNYFEELVRAFYPRHRQQAEDVLLKSANVIRAWFRAQLFDMAIIGLLTTIGLWIVGVKYWALFGLLTGLLGIIPYVGILIVLSAVSFIVLISEPSQFGWVLLVFFITQQIEGNLILPLVMKGTVEIPEALLIMTMLFFSFWFGLIGIFIAPPTVAVLLCLYRNLYLARIENPKDL